MHKFSGLRTITRRIVANIDVKQHSFGLHLMQNLKRLNLGHVIPYGHLLGHFWSLRAAGPHSLVWKITTNHCAEQRKIIQNTGLKQHKGQSFRVGLFTEVR